MREITVKNDDSKQRLDKYLLKYMNASTKSFVYKMLRKKNITLNGKKAEGSELLQGGDKINLYLSEETLNSFMKELTINNPGKEITIIYEDENVLICVKPAGLLSHPESADHTDTMIDRILFYLHEKGEFDISKESVFKPALCNRLDRNTGGIVICGKNLHSLQTLNKAMAEKGIDKYYTALVRGRVTQGGVLRGWHYKDGKTNQSVVAKTQVSYGKEVITEYAPEKIFRGYTLLNIKLVTGKSHQIRAHLKSIGHNIAGDRKYGDVQVNSEMKKYGVSGQLLYASKIVFTESLSGLEYLHGKEFESDLPQKFKKVLSLIQ